jgi:hypothetical protein
MMKGRLKRAIQLVREYKVNSMTLRGQRHVLLDGKDPVLNVDWQSS